MKTRTSFVFASYGAAVMLAVPMAGVRFLQRRAFVALAFGSLAWLTCVGVMSFAGLAALAIRSLRHDLGRTSAPKWAVS